MTTAPGIPVGGLDDRLIQATQTAQRLHVVLEDLITHPASGRSGDRHATVSHSTPPWHAQAAYLITDLVRLVRDVEGKLHLVNGSPIRPRGGSSNNTHLALAAIPKLASGADEQTVADQVIRVESWCHKARQAVGEVEPLHRLPRLAGQSEPRCPWCQRLSLRHQPYAGLVRCMNPECRDADGRRPQGRIEIGRLSDEPLLVWQDNSAGLGDAGVDV